MKLLNKRQTGHVPPAHSRTASCIVASEEHLDVAQDMIDRLTDEKKLDGGEQAYLDALCDLVVVYEDQYHPIPDASDADLLRHLMEAKGVTQTEFTKTRALPRAGFPEVLAGKKPFSKTMIGTLAAYFHVPPSVLTANIGGKR